MAPKTKPPAPGDQGERHQRALPARREGDVGALLRRAGRRIGPAAADHPDIGKAQRDRHDARHVEGGAPVDKGQDQPGQQGRAGDAHIAPHAVDAEPPADIAAALDDHGDADRMIDGGKDADNRQPDADLERGLRHPGRYGGQADADEEHRHHGVAAPFVGQMRGQRGAGGEQHHRRDAVGQHFRIGAVFRQAERQPRAEGRLGEDQHEQVVGEMADIEKQEMASVGGHAHGLQQGGPAAR